MQERDALKVKATQTHLEDKISDLVKQVMDFHTLVTSLDHKIQSLELRNLKVRAPVEI